MSRQVNNDGAGALQIRFPYDARLREIVSKLPSRRWNPDERYWSVPEKNVVAVVDQLHPEGFNFCERTQRLYREHGGALALNEGGTTPGRMGPPGPFVDGRAPDAVPKLPEATGLTVSQLNEKVRGVLKAAFPASMWLVGEVSGFDKASRRRIIDFEFVERDAQGKEVSKVRVVLFPNEYRESNRSAGREARRNVKGRSRRAPGERQHPLPLGEGGG